MEMVLNKYKSKSPGPDGSSYCFIQNIGKTANNFLLKIFSTIWSTGNILKKGKKRIIIPISKPGRIKHFPVCYRPITLLNTMSKIMKTIFNTRIIQDLKKSVFAIRDL